MLTLSRPPYESIISQNSLTNLVVLLILFPFCIACKMKINENAGNAGKGAARNATQRQHKTTIINCYHFANSCSCSCCYRTIDYSCGNRVQH